MAIKTKTLKKSFIANLATSEVQFLQANLTAKLYLMLRSPAVSYSTSEFAANMTINVRNDFEKTSAYLDSRSLTSSCYTEKSTNIK